MIHIKFMFYSGPDQTSLSISLHKGYLEELLHYFYMITSGGFHQHYFHHIDFLYYCFLFIPRLHLLTSTEAVINSEEDLKRSGIEPFVQSTLDPAAHEELLVLCLKLASFLVKSHRKAEEILQLLSPQLNQLFQSDSPAVLAAHLETLVTLLERESLDQCLSVSRSLLESGLWPQLSALLTKTSATHHVVELALTCLVALLGLLHRCSLLTTSSEGSRSINHPTFDKVLKNILVEYFDLLKTSGERRLFKQLRCLLRLTSNERQKAVRTLLLHFILVSVEEEPKSLVVNVPEQDVDVLHVVLNTCLVLKPETGFPELCSRILTTGKPPAQMAVVDMCCRQLSQPSDDDTHRLCTDVLLSVIREHIFSRSAVHHQLRRRFFTKTGLAVLLAPHPVLVDLMATLAQSDIVQRAAESLEFNDPTVVRDLAAQLQFFGVLCRAARRPVLSLTRSEVRCALLSLLAGYAGGSPELKTAVCDLIAVELLEARGEECGQPAEYLPALGTCIVSSAQAWQLRDSAIQV
jgi:hypothetical protein